MGEIPEHKPDQSQPGGPGRPGEHRGEGIGKNSRPSGSDANRAPDPNREAMPQGARPGDATAAGNDKISGGVRTSREAGLANSTDGRSSDSALTRLGKLQGEAKDRKGGGANDSTSVNSAWDAIKAHQGRKTDDGRPRGLEKLKDTLARSDALEADKRTNATDAALDARANPADGRTEKPAAPGDAPGIVRRAREQRNADDAALPGRAGDRTVAKESTGERAGRAGDRTVAKESTGERAERARVAQPADGIGFGHGKDSVDRTALERLGKQLSPDALQSVREGKSTLLVQAGASRDGASEANYALSERRAQNTVAAVADAWRIDPANIKAEWYGEDKARQANKPDNKDDAEDRVAKISIQSNDDKQVTKDDKPVPGDLQAAFQAVSDAYPSAERDKNASEQAKMFGDRGRDFVKNSAIEIAKNPAMAEEIVVKEAVKQVGKWGKAEALWMIAKFADDLSPKGRDLKGEVVGNAIPGMQDALAEFANVEARSSGLRSALFRGEKSPVYRLARDATRDRLDAYPPAVQDNIRRVMHSDQRRKLEQMLEKPLMDYSTRGLVN